MVKMFPTPQAHDAHQGNPERVGRFGTKHGGRNLADEIFMWPTPTARLGTPRGPQAKRYYDPKRSNDLDDAVAASQLFPTPNATDYKGPSSRSKGKERPICDDDLPTRIGGSLNPTWVEWLMGYPSGWTDLNVSAMP
jgi:hypothetical protein